MKTLEKIEDIVLRHSRRSMDVLREYMPRDFCHDAAKEILSWDRGTILLTTGFYVAGFAETDGPAGTMVLAKALETLGYHPVIVTDQFCQGYFECRNLQVEYMPLTEGMEFCKKVLEKYRPVGLISIERCGKNLVDDYANMRGISIGDNTASVDLLFDMTHGKIPSIGIGDGGNEIGMGNVAGVITEKLSLMPCRTVVDYLVIACVSNWGAYAVTACLEKMTGIQLLMSFGEIYDYIKETVKLGSVDGVTHQNRATVDGYEIEVEEEIINSLHAAIA